MVGAPDVAARGDPEDLHDLVAVQVGPDRGQFLLLGQALDAVLQGVVGTLQGPCPALVAEVFADLLEQEASR